MAGLAVGIVGFGAAAWPAAGSARADQASSVRQQMAALQAEVVASASRVRELTLAYDQQNTEAAALEQQVQSDEAQVASLRGQVSSTRQVLREEAIVGYTDGPSATQSVPGSAVGRDRADPAVRAVYFEIAAGDMTNALDEYRTQESQAAAAETNLKTQLQASRAAAAATDAARQQALGTASAVQAHLGQVQAQLDQLLAAQQAAAAQARALAATPQPGGRSPLSGPTSGPATPPSATPPSATQGLPVDNGLVNVVRTVVSPTPAPAPAPGGAGAGGVWLQLRECESGGNYRADTGNGFYGAYQFSQQTWSGLGYPGRPDLEPPAMQDQAAQQLQAEAGWGQWPACSAALGLH